MVLKEFVAEDKMVAEFLKAEINSKRFGHAIKEALGEIGVSIITKPSINAEDDNKYRKWLLGEVRGYGKDADLFENFPSDVIWRRAIFTREDLQLE